MAAEARSGRHLTRSRGPVAQQVSAVERQAPEGRAGTTTRRLAAYTRSGRRPTRPPWPAVQETVVAAAVTLTVVLMAVLTVMLTAVKRRVRVGRVGGC